MWCLDEQTPKADVQRESFFNSNVFTFPPVSHSPATTNECNVEESSTFIRRPITNYLLNQSTDSFYGGFH